MSLRFLAAGASQGLVNTLARDSGLAIDGAFGPVGGIRDRLLAGEAGDVVILTHAQVAELTASGHVDRTAVVDLGAVRTALAVRAGDPKPDLSTPELLRAALVAAKAIHAPDPAKATAGIHFGKVIDALGIRATVGPRLVNHPGGIAAMKALSSSAGGDVGCTQVTEILATPGVTLVAPLPDPHGLVTVYTAAVNARAADAGAAHAFIRRVVDARHARAEAGFEAPAIRRATRADEGTIREVVFGILREYSITPDPEGTDLDLFDLDAHYVSRDGMFDVVEDATGRIVACCGTYATDAASCELRKMYVRREARGHGLGQRLLDRALAFARARGCVRMELETASVLKEAMAMYEKAGFVRKAQAPHVARCDRAYSLALR